MKTQGSVAFSKLPGTAEDQAARYSVNVKTVYDWKAGRKKPGRRRSKQIQADGGPAYALWSLRLESRMPRTANNVPAGFIEPPWLPDALCALADREGACQALLRGLIVASGDAAALAEHDALDAALRAQHPGLYEAVDRAEAVLDAAVWA